MATTSEPRREHLDNTFEAAISRGGGDLKDSHAVRAETRNMLTRLRFFMTRLRRAFSALRSLDGDQRLVHIRLLLLRMSGRRRDTLPRQIRAVRKVVFVCHGNIMRSPVAAACFRRLAAHTGEQAPRFVVESAGLFARAGRSTDARALEVAETMGLSLREHSASPLTAEVVNDADLIVLMDEMNEAVCLSRFPHAEDKVVMLGAFGRLPGEPTEIDDPYMGNLDTVRSCFGRVERAAQGLWSALLNPRE
jgi:protein-tyrosine-phosphatase